MAYPDYPESANEVSPAYLPRHIIEAGRRATLEARKRQNRILFRDLRLGKYIAVYRTNLSSYEDNSDSLIGFAINRTESNFQRKGVIRGSLEAPLVFGWHLVTGHFLYRNPKYIEKNTTSENKERQV